MKICWDSLECVYLSTRGNLRKGSTAYIEVDSCEICKEPFLRVKSQTDKCCSRSCARINISDEHREKLSKRVSGKNHPMYGKKHSEETKGKMSAAQTRDNHWNWKGGISADSRSTPEYNLWRKCIYERDDYTCKMCGTTKGGCFNAHHIFKWKEYPEFRFEVWNGITLCEECHRKTYNKEELYITQFLKINFTKEKRKWQ